MICFLKFHKMSERSETVPEKLIFHKKDGSEIHMTWRAAKPLRNVDSYEDYNLIAAKIIDGNTNKTYGQDVSISQLMTGLKNVELITASKGSNNNTLKDAVFAQINIINKNECIYLIESSVCKVKDKWLKGGKIFFSQHYWIFVDMKPEGRYQCILYHDSNMILTESYEKFPEILELNHENKIFRLLTQ